MSAACTAVLDVGRSSARLSLIGAEGEIVSTTARRTPFVDGPPYPHVETEELTGWLLEELTSRSADVEAIVPVAHGAAAALLGERDLVLPILDYEHELPRTDLGEAAFDETLSPDLPAGLNLGRQLAWLESAFPEDFAAARAIVPYPQFWAWTLSGRAVSEVTSLGCHTHLWDPRRGRFSRLARERGWDRRFAPLEPAWSVAGTLRPELAERTGLSPEVRVHAGIHDSNAAFLVHRIGRDEPFAVVSTGTWVVCMAHGADLDRLDPARDMLANVDAYGDPVACMRFAGGREYAAIAGEAGLGARPGPRDAQRAVDAGTLALPCFAEHGGPFAGRPGSFEPAAPEDAPGRAALACLYSALMIDLALDELGATGDVVLEGPMAREGLVAPLLAALRAGRPVLASDDPTGSVRGAALLARWDEARPLPAPARVGPAAIEGLEAYRARWRELATGARSEGAP